MQRAVAFLRGVNIGGRTILKEQLRDVFTAAGMHDVETFIASGNVIFSTKSRSLAAAERLIEGRLTADFGYPAIAFVRSIGEICALAEVVPFTPERHAFATVLNVGFLREPLTSDQQAQLLGYASSVDDLAATERELFWLCQVRQSESPLFKVPLERRLKVAVSWRNMNTVQRIAAKFGS